MAPLKSGGFSDTGYRFRKNYFERYDEWQPLGKAKDEFFFDITFYNSDTISVDLNHAVIAEMYFRIDIDEIRHTRIVFEFMDWLGAIGGVAEILFQISYVFLGSWLSFNSAVEIIL